MILVQRDYKAELVEKPPFKGNFDLFWKKDSEDYSTKSDIHLERNVEVLSRLINGNFKEPRKTQRSYKTHEVFSKFTGEKKVPQNLTFFFMRDLPYDYRDGTSPEVKIDDKTLDEMMIDAQRGNESIVRSEQTGMFFCLNNVKKRINLIGGEILEKSSSIKENLNETDRDYQKGIKLINTILLANTNLVYSIGKRFGADMEEDFPEMIITLRNSILNYNPNQSNNGFSSYVCNALIKTIKRARRNRFRKYSIMKELESDYDKYSLPNEKNLDMLIGLLEEGRTGLTEKEKEVLNYRFFVENPRTLEEIGEWFNVTKERARQIQNKALRKLAKYFKENGYSRSEHLK